MLLCCNTGIYKAWKWSLLRLQVLLYLYYNIKYWNMTGWLEGVAYRPSWTCLWSHSRFRSQHVFRDTHSFLLLGKKKKKKSLLDCLFLQSEREPRCPNFYCNRNSRNMTVYIPTMVGIRLQCPKLNSLPPIITSMDRFTFLYHRYV